MFFNNAHHISIIMNNNRKNNNNNGRITPGIRKIFGLLKARGYFGYFGLR